MTAHEHFKNGCPALALEVLTKLPEVIDVDSDITKSRSADIVCNKKIVSTGTIDIPDPVQSGGGGGGASAFDLDWSQPARTFEEEKLCLDFSSSEEDEEQGDKSKTKLEKKEPKLEQREDQEAVAVVTGGCGSGGVGDVMAHQLKFIACIKIIVDELSTLATGFEVDGGQLRYQLYVWLEKEVEVLKKVCGYGSDIDLLESSASEKSGKLRALSVVAGLLYS